MKESDLKGFLDGDLDAAWLGRVTEEAEPDSALEPDLGEEQTLAPVDLVRLCDAHIDGGLTLDALRRIAGAILASEHFAWDETLPEGELVAAVLWDWTQPDDDVPLSTEAIARHRRALAETAAP